MIEVLFGESESASMKVAKCTNITEKPDGPTSVWIAGKKETTKERTYGVDQGNFRRGDLSWFFA